MHRSLYVVRCGGPGNTQGAWGGIITQIPSEQISLPIHDQHHEPLLFLGARFRGAEKRWSLNCKEAAAINFTFEKGADFLHTSKPILLYTDHSNLQYVFTARRNKDLKRSTQDRLQRWAMNIQAYEYEIRHIPGANNVWADILSRTSYQEKTNSIHEVIFKILTDEDALRIRPMTSSDFEFCMY